MMYFIGCDPGQSGGFVVLDQFMSVVSVFKTPETKNDFVAKLTEIKSLPGNIFLMKERVHSQPKNGGKSNFTFGYNIGVLEASLSFVGIPYQDITPQTWMKWYMLKKEKEETGPHWKARLKQRAQELFPDQKITLWNADAFLIAEYCRRIMQGTSAS